MKVDNLAQLQDFVQHLLSNLIKTMSLKVPITHLLEQHVQVAVADEARFADQSDTRANHNERATAPLLTGMSSDSLHLSYGEEKKKPGKERVFLSV